MKHNIHNALQIKTNKNTEKDCCGVAQCLPPNNET